VLVLEALAAHAPLPATAKQIAAMVGKPRQEVHALLVALATLGTIQRYTKGLYRLGPPAAALRPSSRFAAQIAAVCRPEEAERG
jgi:DNA-binding IclR family transcriptional regulator